MHCCDERGQFIYLDVLHLVDENHESRIGCFCRPPDQLEQCL
jgi:hypothetical protein